MIQLKGLVFISHSRNYDLKTKQKFGKMFQPSWHTTNPKGYKRCDVQDLTHLDHSSANCNVAEFWWYSRRQFAKFFRQQIKQIKAVKAGNKNYLTELIEHRKCVRFATVHHAEKNMNTWKLLLSMTT